MKHFVVGGIRVQWPVRGRDEHVVSAVVSARGSPVRVVGIIVVVVAGVHREGQTDLLACLRAYREVGFEGVLRPDHVPTVEGDSNERPGYSSFGRLYAIGYIRGLRHAVYREGT